MSSDHLIVLQLLYHWVVVRVIRLLHWGRIKRSAKSFRCVVTHYLYVVKNHCFVLLITFCINTKDSFILYWSQITLDHLLIYFCILIIFVLQYTFTNITDHLLLKVLYLLHLSTYTLLFSKRVNDLWEVRNYTTAFFVFTHSVH